MDGICQELDEAKAEIERLNVVFKIEAELSEYLKRAHREQLAKNQEANLKIEKQTQELNEKAEEIALMNSQCEDQKSSLVDKESIIKRLSAANDELRAAGNEKCREWEDEKQRLILVLDEMNEKSMEQEKTIFTCKEEINGLKKRLSVSQRKCLEEEEKARAPKELRERDDVIFELEEENRKLNDQLKWKREQFKHLEEALEKLREQFKTEKNEWEAERSKLIDKMCSLQKNLDSQTRISKDLQNQLEMCNQALAHEESKRKHLQVQVSEYQMRLENVCAECDDAKLQLEDSTAQRDKEIAALRHSLSSKDMFHREMKCRKERLEQENQELREALKELQECHIQEAGATSSLVKMRNKLKSLETVHRACNANLSAKEAEWSVQLEKMTSVLKECESALARKEESIEGLNAELECKDSLIMQLKLQNEELSIMLLVLKLGISEAQLMLANEKDEMILHDKVKEEKFSLLLKQIEMQNAALERAQESVKEEHQKAVTLLRRVESLDLIEEQHNLKQKELDRYKEMLEESSRCQLRLKEQILQVEHDAREKLREVCDALDRANTELVEKASLWRRVESLELIEKQRSLKVKELDTYKELFEESSRDQLRLKEQVLQIEHDAKDRLKEACDALDRVNFELAVRICEGNEIEFELQMWKSISERLKADLEENHELRKELEASLLAQVDVGESIKVEKDKQIDNLQQQIVLLNQELKIRELDAATSAETERAMYFVSEKDSLILEQLLREVELLEQESLRRELEGVVLAQLGEERMNEQNKKILQLLEEKSVRINDLMQLLEPMERKFNSALASFSAELAEKQEEINLLQEACEKITVAETLAVVEIEEKKLMIMELEEDIEAIQQKLELQEPSLAHLKEQAFDIDAELEAKESELKNLTNQMKMKLKLSDMEINELKSEKTNLLEDVLKLSSERENLLCFIGGIGDQISEFSMADNDLTSMLQRIVLFGQNGSGLDFICDNEHISYTKENMEVKKFEVTPEVRSPFRELNS